jgi:polysaccharide export outer membrane protein
MRRMRSELRRLFWVATVLLCAGGLALAAPPSPGADAIRQELEARGLSEEEIAKALEQAGVVAGGEVAGAPTPAAIPEPAREILAGEEGQGEGELPPPPPPVAAEAEEPALRRFGLDLFALAPTTFAPPVYGPIDPGYRIGPGDEIVIDVWGDTVFRLEKIVNREGNVLLADVGQVSLSGLTLQEAKERLRGQLSKAYSGLAHDPPTTFLDVSLGKLRPIKVFVVGEVRRPGAYDLSAASTVFHALYYAGGPGERGTLRDVQVVRGGETVAHLDVYEYLLRGRRIGDIRLENDDTIFVPVRGPMVAARGEITRPALYELRGDESLVDLIQMAGGVTAKTYLERAHVNRILPARERHGSEESRVVMDVDLNAVLAGELVFRLEDLDDVHFLPIVEEKRNYVEVNGNVWRPGTYELTDGMRVSDLVLRADSLKGDAFLKHAMIVRTHEDLSKETLVFDLESALAGDPHANLRLEPWDELMVFSIWDLQERESVRIQGAVRSPGTYELTEGMTLGDLLLKAGGFVENAYTVEVEVSRVYPEDPDVTQLASTFHVAVGEGLESIEQLPEFALQNHDNVFVRRQPYWELQRNVTVEGEVLFPGTYTLMSPVDRVSDILERAGGLLETAYPDGFQLQREKDDIGRVSVNLSKALADYDSDDNLILSEGDTLRVPERLNTVRVSGAVGLPTSLVFQQGKGISYYVDNAGGYLDTAKKGEVKVIYSTGRAAKVKRFRRDPRPEPGSVIIVPAKGEEEGIDWGETIKDVTSILASLATTYLVIDRISD